ncbi:MAG: hypothetical protein DCC55_10975 [Chloroflexi bacterium]|nr:MAG: hypothetical protein DCC55_10975 [Chloroflexota bacterium]
MSKRAGYADVEIRILERQEQGYPVEITVDDAQEFPRGYLDPSFLPWHSEDDPERDGQRIFQWLFNDERLRAAWVEVRGAQPLRRVRLRIDAAAPELHALPWELLHEAHADQTPIALAASGSTPFSRYLAGTWQPGGPILKRPIRILVVIPEPKDFATYGLEAFDTEAEWRNLQESVSGLANEGVVELVRLGAPSGAGFSIRDREGNQVTVGVSTTPPATFSALEAALKQGYHILHFVGHGAFDPQTGTALIVMANEQNEVEFIRDADFSAMLARLLAATDQRQDDKLRLVYLDSCATATRDTGDAFRGFAPALVRTGVPAVVAMQDLIEVTSGQAFSGAFYRQLLQHGQVDLACNEARGALLTAQLPGAEIPVLFMRLRNGLLFGQRGQILSDQASSFWNTLLDNIANGECTPFLGPGLTADFLPTPAEIAEELALSNSYPFLDHRDLPSVAQFIGTTDLRRLLREVQRITADGFRRRLGLKPDGRVGRQRLTEVITAADWSQVCQQLVENEIHHQLADLRLPLYITTNQDNFMALALEARLGHPTRRILVDWRTARQQIGRPQYNLDPPASPDDPVVLHLFGSLGDDQELLSVVLTEDDHLDYLARIARDYEYLLPTDVTSALASTTLLFLGYHIDDLALKVILRGLLTNLDLERWGMLHVAVQVEADTAEDAKQNEVIRYFERYFSRSKIDVYWGSAHQFVSDLATRWQEYQHG